MKKFFSIVAAMLLTVSAVSAKTLYFNSGAWASQPGRFAIYCITNESWVDLEAINGGTDMYQAAVDDAVTMVVFCRMNPELPANEWASLWNQTEDLTIPEGQDLYTITGWGEGYGAKATGAWSTYGVEPAPAPETAPAAPTHDEANVMAIYCNHYATNNANFAISGWAGGYQTLDLNGTNAAYWTGMTWECIIDPAHTDDAHDFSAYENVHVDMWAPAAAQIKFTAEAVAGGNYKDGVVLDLVAGWNFFDIELAGWPGNYDFANMKCFVLEQYKTPEGESFEGNPFAIANIYFWNEAKEGITNTAVSEKAEKMIKNGMLLIIKGDKTYNVMGQIVK